MNYEKSTDFQLNVKLAELLGLDLFECQDPAIKSKSSSVLICDNSGSSKEFNYCKYWNTTMPLAIEHGITALSCDDVYEVSYDYEAPTGSYGCGETLSSHINVEKSGVLRAIVICLINKLEGNQ